MSDVFNGRSSVKYISAIRHQRSEKVCTDTFLSNSLGKVLLTGDIAVDLEPAFGSEESS